MENGGEFLSDLIKAGVFSVLNNLDKSDKGPWTWIDRKDNNIKSCLDIAIALAALVPYVANVEVDRQILNTTRSVIKKNDMIT